MNILILGNGGREQALAWRISQDSRVENLWMAPDNSASIGQPAKIPLSDHNELIHFAKKNKIDLTVVGPEAPLFEGVVDQFRKKGLPIFGPTKAAAEIERSKIFAKHIMTHAGVPTADSKVIAGFDEALEYVSEIDGQCVIKAPGPALGKGVHVCDSIDEAKVALETILVHKAYGEEPALIEEKLSGPEISFYVMTDGEHILPLPVAQDHKTIYEGGKGPMTGGMGAYAPAPVLSSGQYDEIIKSIVVPTLHTLKLKDRCYTGVLFIGLMLTPTGPKVLEYNCRFGDPETQALMMLWDRGLLDALLAASGRQSFDDLESKIDFFSGFSTCVVMASKGYPQTSTKGCLIEGLDQASQQAHVFHAGTYREGNRYYTNGGRVLGVTSRAKTLKEATDKAYRGIEAISFEGAQFRRDIGSQAL